MEDLEGNPRTRTGGKLFGRQWQLTTRVILQAPAVLPEAVALFDV